MAKEKKFSLFVTSHDVVRIYESMKIEPFQFLVSYPPDYNYDLPVFKIKGREYILGLDPKYENLKFWIRKPVKREIEEYRNIVEIWNRNFGDKGSFAEFLNFVIQKIKL
jgi:hypothetical protein